MKPRTPQKAKSSGAAPRKSVAPPSTKKKRIFLVDDHPMMRDALCGLLNNASTLVCCGGAQTAEQAVADIPAAKPDLVITDITLAQRSGLELIKDLVALLPGLPVLVYSMHDEMFYAERALRAGAKGYLMKEAGSERL